MNFCQGQITKKWALDRRIICLVQDHSRNISVKVLSKYLQWLNNKCHFANFPLHVYNSLSYHYHWVWALAIQNIKFVEANTNNISAKSQSYIPYGFWGDDFKRYFFYFFAFWFPWQPIKMSTGQKNHPPDRGPLKEQFCQNICNGLAVNAIFNFPHYKSMETLSCHSNQTKEPIFIKKQTFNLPAQGCYRWNLDPTHPVASEEMSFESADARWQQTTYDDGQLPIL